MLLSIYLYYIIIHMMYGGVWFFVVFFFFFFGAVFKPSELVDYYIVTTTSNNVINGFYWFFGSFRANVIHFVVVVFRNCRTKFVIIFFFCNISITRFPTIRKKYITSVLKYCFWSVFLRFVGSLCARGKYQVNRKRVE